MEPFQSHSRSQTAIFLAGCILSCLLQMVSAQENLTVASIPEHPIQGQSILLDVVENIQETFEECEWTQPSGNKIIFARGTKFTPVNTSQVVVVHQNCSLTIKNLRPSDQGRYTVKVTVPPTKQQTRDSIYIGSIFLILCDEKQIRIKVQPPSPKAGQDVVMTPQGIPDTYDHCEWNQKTESGVSKEFQDSGQESNKQENQQQMIQQGCSLHLTQITQAHSGEYSVYVEVFSGQHSAKEKGNREEMKCYRSQTQLKVVSVSGSTSVKYSVGIIAGALLGSLTWASSLSLVPLLFGMLSLFSPEC
ncbi:pregnancy-specific glycoprotein 22-like isoform X2 [Notechis scutatus]|uniref:Pregnancy-specific glycoprotein 22-like isoform X2 n=1 Tax=Notechis scutatus TaxID=8663 RepID=A0A6J1V353_9SAUR|nr:pregnancy-specific glycoprotein 22-like isoform X2 [Notechis scutatus]XP_026537185.1 pregnancy-specific glycoprotein 22-like isoform X2 [Notechis scutatus]